MASEESYYSEDEEEDYIGQLFKSLDRDGDGALNESDLEAVMPDVDPERIQELIAILDSNGDGSITFEEFRSNFDAFVSASQGDNEDDDDDEYDSEEYDEFDEEFVPTGAVVGDSAAAVAPALHRSDSELGLPQDVLRSAQPKSALASATYSGPQSNDASMSSLKPEAHAALAALFVAIDADRDHKVIWLDLKSVFPAVPDHKLETLFEDLQPKMSETNYLTQENFIDAFPIFEKFVQSSGQRRTFVRWAKARGIDLTAAGSDISTPVGGLRKARDSIMHVDGKSIDLIERQEAETRELVYGTDYAEPNKAAAADDATSRTAAQMLAKKGFSEVQEVLDSDTAAMVNAADAEAIDTAEDYFGDDLVDFGQELTKDEQIDLLKHRLRKVISRARSARRKYQLLGQVGREIEDDNLTMTEQLEVTQDKLRHAQDEVAELRDTVDDYRKMVKALQSKESNLRGAYRETQETYEDAIEQLTHEQQQKMRMQTALAEMKEKVNALQQNRSTDARLQIQNRISQMRQIMESRRQQGGAQLKARVSELEEENEQLKARIEELELDLEVQVLLVAELEEKIRRLTRSVERRGVSLKEQLADEEQKLPSRKPKASKSRSRKATLNAKTMLRRMERNGTVSSRGGEDIRFRNATMVPSKMTKKADRKRTFTSAMAGTLRAGTKNRSKNAQPIIEASGDGDSSQLLSRLQLEQKFRLDLERRNQVMYKKVQDLESLLKTLQGQQQEQESKKKRDAAAATARALQVHLSPHQLTEVKAYATYLNHCLGGDPDLASHLPINPDGPELLSKIKDGWILAKFLNLTEENTIDERVLNKSSSDRDASVENLTLVIESCRAVGMQTNKFTPMQILESHNDPQAVIDFMWGLIKVRLMSMFNLRGCPELIRVKTDKEDRSDLMRASPEALQLRWVNFHCNEYMNSPDAAAPLKAMSGEFPLAQILQSERFNDASAPTMVMHMVARDSCDATLVQSIMDEKEPSSRVESLLGVARMLQMAPAEEFITPQNCTDGSSTAARMWIAFLANLFLCSTGFANDDTIEVELVDDDGGDSREERAFRLWINSLGIKTQDDSPLYIHNLFGECRDGLLLLRIMDRIKPGSVNWRKVELKPTNRFARVGNCNEVVSVGTSQLNLSLVNVGGTDLASGNKKLTLSVVWQLMHFHITAFLQEVYFKKFGQKKVPVGKRSSVFARLPDSKETKDSDKMIVDWANRRVIELTKQERMHIRKLKGTPFEFPYTTMKSLNDPTLSNSLFLLHLLWAIEPRVVNWQLVTRGDTDTNKLANARYCISVARKLGATIFLLPEDIAEVKPKMIMGFVSALLALDGERRC
jgi:plastin-1